MRCTIPTFLIVVLLSASLYAQSEKPLSEARSYPKEHWGFTVTLPEAWNIHREVDVPDEFRVSFGMPKIWSEKENANIENAISISAYRSKSLATEEDVVRHEDARCADILLSKKEVECEQGTAFDSKTRINRLEYMSRTVCRHVNDLGYVIAFTATEGTFEQNLPVFEKFVSNISFEKPTAMPIHLKERNHYELALEYYKFGPSHAESVISQLKQHVANNADDENAFMLLGITQKGIGSYDDALKSFDQVERITITKKSIKHKIFLLRAECYYHKREFKKAHEVLEPAWAFFQSNQREKDQYDALMKSIRLKMDESRDE